MMAEMVSELKHHGADDELVLVASIAAEVEDLLHDVFVESLAKG